MTQKRQGNPFKRLTVWATASSIAMIVLGSLAFILPRAAGFGFAIFVGLLMLMSGLWHFIYAFAAWGPGSFLGRSLIGTLYALAGIVLLTRPGVSLPALTLGLAITLAVEGIIELSFTLAARALPGAGWLLFDGIATILLSVLIWAGWPSDATWVLGTLLGINLILSGLARLFYAANAGKSVSILVEG